MKIHRSPFHILLVTAFFALSSQLSGQPHYDKYIEDHFGLAIEQMRKHGIPASITLAQALLESGAGTSRLATKANNHFGIKCHAGWKGKYIKQDDDEKGEKFRVYKNVEQSYEDHSLFLKRERYQELFRIPADDYKSWAKGLKKCGYATNPRYAEMLISVIERYDLTKYDRKNKYLFTRELFFCNKLPYIIAKEGDTWKSLAKLTGISARRIRKYNELPKSSSIAEGTIIFLEKKRNKADKTLKGHVHTIKPDESIHSISQMYGIRIKTLYKLNHLSEDYVPQAGQLLKIR